MMHSSGYSINLRKAKTCVKVKPMFDWSKQVILLTGGTGSFGQAFTRYILSKHKPKTLRIYSRDEFKQYEMQQEFDYPALRFFIGDVRDSTRLTRAIEGATLVIHAAAMKQIVACEYNPTEAIETNIIGTMNVLNAALNLGVPRVFGLITDKAVSPINLYGATKLCMEKLLVRGNSYRGERKTRISCARYGNVTGSRGSVIPLFLKQKEKGTLTITHKDATRFWITLEEGVKFVIKAVESMRGGEIFIPKMPSFKVIDLASVIAPNAKIKVTGLRPGEKLHEDLITVHEAQNAREFKEHFIIKPELIFWTESKELISFNGKPVMEAFSYNSKTNPRFLTKKELASYLKRLNFLGS